MRLKAHNVCKLQKLNTTAKTEAIIVMFSKFIAKCLSYATRYPKAVWLWQNSMNSGPDKQQYRFDEVLYHL